MLYFISTNRSKFEEVSRYLAEYGIKVKWVNEGYLEVQGDSLQDIVLHAINWCIKKKDKKIMIEDSGLFIQAIGGFPGVYSAYVFKKLGNAGILRLMQGLERKAYFESAIAFGEPCAEPKIFTGKVTGKIATKQLGSSGFGFDPIFIPAGFNKTFAQLGIEVKNKISHRAKALKKFCQWYKVNYL